MILFTDVDYLPYAVFDTVTLKAGQKSIETIALFNIIGFVLNRRLFICSPVFALHCEIAQ